MKDRLFIGLMSGTSVDAIDAALVRIGRKGNRYTLEVLAHHEHPWPRPIRQRLLNAMAPAITTTAEICQLNFIIAEQFARAVEDILHKQKLSPAKITALASHGQTLCHFPPNPKSKIKNQKYQTPSTLQLGDASVLATLTGIPTVANFRTADMAAGGQGAPLVPWTDDALLSHPTKTRAIQNIGGIANVTYLPALFAPARTILAFDTGPGNMLLDAVISLATNGKHRFDKNGQRAAKGTLDPKLFRKLQSHPYFEKHPPKSTGREAFGIQLAEQLLETQNWKLEILLHTLTRLTAWSIADAYLHFLPQIPDEIILCGGGADNPTLTRMLQEEFATLTSSFTNPNPPAIRRIDDLPGGGIPNKSKEATSFALLAAATLDGIPANLPSVTGASRPVILGTIAFPLRPNPPQ